MPGEQKKSTDPYLGFKFWNQIDGINVGGFTECSPITMETEVFEYSEGGLNTYTHKLPVRTKYTNITLKHGIDPGQDLEKWYLDSLDGSPNARKNISIILYSHTPGEVVRTYNLLRAYPVKWIGADMRSDPAAGAIETLELAHDGLQDAQTPASANAPAGESAGAGGALSSMLANQPAAAGGGAAPSGGGAPGIPSAPSAPSAPSLPKLPSVPNLPSFPALPSVPHLPSAPSVPDLPHLPSVPDVPSIPDAPKLPDLPKPPELPSL